MSARYIVGDSCDVLRSLPDGSVDLVLTSPPWSFTAASARRS